MYKRNSLSFLIVLLVILLLLPFHTTSLIQTQAEADAAQSQQVVETPQSNTFTDLSKILLTKLGKQGLVGVRDFTYAPNGKEIAFVGEFQDTWAFVNIQVRRQKTDLWLTKRDGTSLQRLTNNGKSYDYSWSPSGKEIVFVSEGSVKILNLRTGQQKRLQGLEGSRPYRWECDYTEFSEPKWSPNGRIITANGGNGCSDGQIVVAEAKQGRKLFEYETASYEWTKENGLMLGGCGPINIDWNSIGVLGRVPANPHRGKLN